MHPPKNFWILCLRAFRAVGITLAGCGILCLAKLLPFFANFTHNPGGTFILLGCVCFLLCFLCYGLSRRLESRQAWLWENGEDVIGTVTAIERRPFCRWNGYCPYVLAIGYTVGEKSYTCHSLYLWERPTCQVGEPIPLQVNPQLPKQATIAPGFLAGN